MSKISELSDGGSLQSTDYLIAVRSGGNVKVQADGNLSLGTLTLDGLTVDTSTLHVDATNNRVGVGTTSPATELEVRGTTPITVSRDLQITAADSGFGHYRLSARYDATNYGVGASINALSDGAWSSTSLPTKLMFYTAPSGSTAVQERLRLSPTEAVFNASGNDTNFRVSSDNNTNMLFVDASIDSVGIGTGSPSSTFSLDVAGAIRSQGTAPGLTLYESDASNQQWIVGSYGGTIALRDVTGGTYPFQITTGSPTNSILIQPDSIRINENSADQDFRVESNNNTHALFVDAGNNRVGVLNSSPTATYTQGTSNQSTGTAATVIFASRSGEMTQKQIYNGGTNSSETIDLLTIDSYQTGNSNVFIVVEYMLVHPVSAYGQKASAHAFIDNGGSSSVGTFTASHTEGSPPAVPTLSWSSNTLRMVTPAVAFAYYVVKVSYVTYDGATVSFDTTKYDGS